METKDLDSAYSQIKFLYEFTMNNSFSSKQRLLLCCYIISVLCFPFCLEGFCVFLATLKYPWILNFFFLISKDFSKHIVSDGQMELILKHNYTFIWCSYYFKRPFCVILQYLHSNREFFFERKNNTQAAWFPLSIRHNYFFKD